MKKIVFFVLVIMALFGFSDAALAGDVIYSATADGELSLYISPTEQSFVAATVPACVKMELLEEDGTWGLVNVKNKCGWVNLSFTRKSYNEAAESTGGDIKRSVTVDSERGKTTLYTIPSADACAGGEEYCTIPNGTVLKITRETSSGWGLVSMNGEYSWVAMKDTKAFKEDNDTEKYGIYYVYVLSKSGRGTGLWDSPSERVRYDIIPDCVRLTVQETRGNYGLVAYDGKNGWIDLGETAQSLLTAQMAAGEEVNEEYTLIPPPDGQGIKVLSVPSQNTCDGAVLVAEIRREKTVFVLRRTMNGWGLIYQDGTLGFVPSQGMFPVQEETAPMIETLETPIQGSVFTEKHKGMNLFSKPDGKTKTVTIPECVKVNVVAQKDGYEFIICDYACGWAKEGEYTTDLKSALASFGNEKSERYIIKKDTALLSLPTEEILCHSEILADVDKHTVFECIGTVTSGKDRWAYTEFDGKTGWIRLGDARKASFIYFVLLGILSGLIIICGAITALIVLKKRKDKNTKGEEENETCEELHNEHRGSREKTPDVSNK